MSWKYVILLAAGATGAAAAQGPAGADQLAIHAVRFSRGDRTLVNGFVLVPHELLSAVTLGPRGGAAFRLDVSVADQEGTVLTEQSWTREVPWSTTQVRGAATVELVAFALAPGSYAMRVVVTDSASGRRSVTTTTVEAYAARPAASDVLLASRIRRAQAPDDTVPTAGEVRKGELLITAAPRTVLTPQQASLYYYCEVYGDSAGLVVWDLRVTAADGRALVTTPRAESQVAPGGGLLSGAVELAGLPPGRYTLTLGLGTGRDSITRTATFEMGGLELAQRVATATGGPGGPPDPFARMTEAQLDTVFAPLLYLASRSELSVYDGLTVEGKRRFLEQFWRQRDPTPGTPVNEAQADFYQRIGDANRRFREGGAAQIPGWRTDRGRLLIQHGQPEDVLRRPSSAGTRPWEAWRYTRPRLLKYVFYDETGLGNYVLIYTNDRRERSFPNWDAILGREAVDEILRF